MTTEDIWKDLSVWQQEIRKRDLILSRKKPVHDKALPAIRQPTELVLDNLKPVGLNSLTSNKGPLIKNKAEAEAAKAKGNEYFGKKDFKNAIVYYGKAIDLNPTVAVYFVNRAMAHLKLNKFVEAEKDCTKGIQLEPRNVKALWRRGIALRELGKIHEAKRDFELGLSIEPTNKSIMDELAKISLPTIEQKRRLPIHVIDKEYSESKLPTLTKVQVKEPKATPSNSGSKISETKQSNDAPKITETKQSKSIPKITETAPTTTVPTTNAPIKTAPPKTPPPTGTASTKTAPPKTPPPTETASAKTAPPKTPPPTETAPAKITPTKTTPPMKFTCPRTNFEFERDWKTYKNRGDDILYQYLQCIPPSSFATLFKSSLESDQFEKMIELLESKYAKELTAQQVFNMLEGLSQVKRIDMLVMFLSKKHQQAIQGLFDMIKSSNSIPIDKLTKVCKIYGARI